MVFIEVLGGFANLTIQDERHNELSPSQRCQSDSDALDKAQRWCAKNRCTIVRIVYPEATI